MTNSEKQEEQPERFCNTCKFYKRNPTALNQGVCKRFPPTMIPLPTPNGMELRGIQPAVGSKTGECGEYIEKDS